MVALRKVKHAIESAAFLDTVGKPLQAAVAKAIEPTEVKNALNGTFLGHPLHPLLTDIPIGAWSMAVVLDVIGGKKGRPAADRLIALGILSAIPTAATGAANWSEFDTDKPRRMGVVHAVANSTALTLFAASYVARKRGKRLKGKALALAGTGAMSAGGWLGGHLTYELGIGVNRNAFLPTGEPSQWTDTVNLDELTDGTPHLVTVGDAPVVLVRHGHNVQALSNTCNHMGGPLHEGQTHPEDCITCPWHGSTFRLSDGEVVRSPAVSAQSAYEARVLGGVVQIKSKESA